MKLGMQFLFSEHVSSIQFFYKKIKNCECRHVVDRGGHILFMVQS
jgi:hypothetical protein